MSNGNDFNSELWTKIVFNYAASYRNLTNDAEIYSLLDTLKIFWLGRFVSYAKQVEHMDISQAEKVIQTQADVFENNFEYLKTIYNNDNLCTLND